MRVGISLPVTFRHSLLSVLSQILKYKWCSVRLHQFFLGLMSYLHLFYVWVVCDTYCVVLLFCLFSSCVLYIPSLFIFDCRFIRNNDYFLMRKLTQKIKSTSKYFLSAENAINYIEFEDHHPILLVTSQNSNFQLLTSCVLLFIKVRHPLLSISSKI